MRFSDLDCADLFDCVPDTDHEDDAYTEFLAPEEGDYTTEDYERWYECGTGRLVLCVMDDEDWRDALRERMDRERFWPNVWWISDHGNCHLLSLLSL